MKIKSRAIFFFLLVLLLTPQNSYGQNQKIDVYIDAKKIGFDVEPIIIDGRTLVPMRQILEELGAEIKWDGKSGSVTSIKDGKTVKLALDSEYIYIDGAREKIDSVPINIDGRTMIPLRIISEVYGFNVKWISRTKDIIIYSNGIGINSGGKEIGLGMSTENLRSILGEPNRIDLDIMDDEWYVYNPGQDYRDFIMINIHRDRVVGFKTNSLNWSLTEDISPGKKYKGENYYKELNSYYWKKSFYIEVLPDRQSGKINGISAYRVNPDYKYRKLNVKQGQTRFTYTRPVIKNKYSNKDLQTLGKQIFDFTNVQRVNSNMKPFIWDDNLEKLARDHSLYMRYNDYFSHDRKDISFKDRMSPYFKKYKWTSIGENIILGDHEPMAYVNIWYNSDKHRDNILSSTFDKLGIAGVYNKEKTHIYFTQNFAK